jgi:cytoskeletal protein RodZ
VGAFGEKLRKQREQRNIALDAISNTTKISTRMLRALEDEHFDQLPGGVFNKGFVRAYARQVGLDEEEAIADYLTALRESQIQAQSILPDFRDLHNHNLRGNAPLVDEAPGDDLHSQDPRSQDPHGKDLHREDLHTEDLPGTDLPGKDLRTSGHRAHTADRSKPLIRDDRRKHGRRNEDHDKGRNAGQSAGRNVDGRNVESRNEARGPKDFPSFPDLAARARAASPPAERFRQKYPAGNPGEPSDQAAAQIPWGKLAIALLCVTLVLALWNSRRHTEPASALQPAAAATQSSATQSSATQSPANQPSTNHSPASAPEPAAPATQHPASVTSLRDGKTPPADALTLSPGKLPARTISPATTPSASSTLALSAAPASSASLKAAPAAAPEPAPSTKPAASSAGASPRVAKTPAVIPPKPFTLLIRAEKTTWVSIMADGKPVAEETLIAPAHTSVRATAEVVVKTGNAAGVSFQLNGKDVAAQGNEGEVKTYVFNATGVRPSPPAQSPAADR